VGLETCHLLVPRMAVSGIGEIACLPIVIDWSLWFPEINASINIPGATVRLVLETHNVMSHVICAKLSL